MLLEIVMCLLIGYVFGCISSSFLIGKLNGIDIRTAGSGNAGTTNALRTLGFKAGMFTFLGDILKVIIPTVAVRLLVKDADYAFLLFFYTGLGAVLGHNYPVWLRFHGGKGIAVTSGLIIALGDWRIVVFGLALFIVVVAITKYVSLGSLIVAWYLPLYIVLLHRENRYFVHILVLGLLLTGLAYIKHWANIKRLLNGTENKFSLKK